MKIVALGDSLTVGETGFSDSEESASYTKYLETLAKQHLASLQSGVEVNVLNRGINGDLTSGMLERFSRDVVDEKADYVIILGGTNDLGWGFDPAMIAHNLTTMYDAALNKGIVTVACSVPSILGFDSLIPPRLQLNRMIRTEAEKKSIPFVDFFTAKLKPTKMKSLSSRVSRKAGVKGLYAMTNGSILRGSDVLLMDDVTTSGSTVSECGQTLLNGGAKTVNVLVAGRDVFVD
jgi:lysophospholipase L1-like esterase